jgi:uncharacterized membrane protein
MSEKMKTILENGKKVLKNLTIYGIVILSCLASFFIGFYYNKVTTKEPEVKIEVVKVKKNEVNLAVDQNNNLIIIDVKSGNYTIYEDSVGNTIFSLYAKNVWGQHSQVINP